jgi:hypothetical protein
VTGAGELLHADHHVEHGVTEQFKQALPDNATPLFAGLATSIALDTLCSQVNMPGANWQTMTVNLADHRHVRP